MQGASTATGEFEMLERLAQVVAGDDPRAQRLGEVGLSVVVRSTDQGCTSLRLTLAEGRRLVDGEPGPADVDFVIDAAVFDAWACGGTPLQALLLKGLARCTGPAQRFLSFEPVLRSLLREINDGRPTAQVTGISELPADGIDELWALWCRGLSKELGGKPVLRDVNMGIPEGLITVVLGPSGTGKSVLLKHLVGLMRPDSGDVSIRGRPIGAMSLAELLAFRRRCGILFQDGALWSSMTLYDNIALPLREHTNLSEAEIATVVRTSLEQVGLAGAEDRMPAALSGGMRKRAGFARALVLDPEIILFDEPDSGLDPVRTALLAGIVKDTHEHLGGTYVVITHDISTARRLADYIIVLWQGSVVEAGMAEDVFASQNPFVAQFLAGQTDGPLGMD